MFTISSNSIGVDAQAADALEYLRTEDVAAYTKIRKNFPETFIFDKHSTWFDYEAMGVDLEYGSWLVDAIENGSDVEWIDGEPFVIEDGDIDEDGEFVDHDE